MRFNPISPDWWWDTLERVHWQNQICRYKCYIESKVIWNVGKDLNSPNKTGCKGKTCSLGPLGQVCSSACLHLSVCLWVTSIKRFNPFLCKSCDVTEHRGWISACQPAHLSKVTRLVCWSRNKCLHPSWRDARVFTPHNSTGSARAFGVTVLHATILVWDGNFHMAPGDLTNCAASFRTWSDTGNPWP